MIFPDYLIEGRLLGSKRRLIGLALSAALLCGLAPKPPLWRAWQGPGPGLARAKLKLDYKNGKIYSNNHVIRRNLAIRQLRGLSKVSGHPTVFVTTQKYHDRGFYRLMKEIESTGVCNAGGCYYYVKGRRAK